MNASVSSWRQPPGATASAPKWAASRAQSHQPDFARRGREDDEIEERHELLAPAGDGSAQHPIETRQKHLAHQAQALGGGARGLVGRRSRQPEIIIAVVMGRASLSASARPSVVTPEPEAPIRWMRRLFIGTGQKI